MLFNILLKAIGSFLDKKYEKKTLILNAIVSILASLLYFFKIMPCITANKVLIVEKLIKFWWLGFDPIVNHMIDNLNPYDAYIFVNTALILKPFLPGREFYVNTLWPYLVTRSRMVPFNIPSQSNIVPFQGHPQWIWYNLGRINNTIFFTMHMLHQSIAANVSHYTFPPHPFTYKYPVFGENLEYDIVASRVLSFTFGIIYNNFSLNNPNLDNLVIKKGLLDPSAGKWYSAFLMSNERNPNNSPEFREFCHAHRIQWQYKGSYITSRSITILKEWLPRV